MVSPTHPSTPPRRSPQATLVALLLVAAAAATLPGIGRGESAGGIGSLLAWVAVAAPSGATHGEGTGPRRLGGASLPRGGQPAGGSGFGGAEAARALRRLANTPPPRA
jgi:hypothetical protein